MALIIFNAVIAYCCPCTKSQDRYASWSYASYHSYDVTFNIHHRNLNPNINPCITKNVPIKKELAVGINNYNGSVVPTMLKRMS